jgi:hypothetical protein
MTWEEQLDRQLPRLGHRNWIVVADGAYPWQTAPGIETVCTGAAQIDVLRGVLAGIDRAPHVRPVVYLDAELPFLSEQHATGISAYRDELGILLAGRAVRQLPHEDIITRLDAAGRSFHVLLLKTTLRLPYTSVFLELDCGYWSSEAEQRLRQAIAI